MSAIMWRPSVASQSRYRASAREPPGALSRVEVSRATARHAVVVNQSASNVVFAGAGTRQRASPPRTDTGTGRSGALGGSKVQVGRRGGFVPTGWCDRHSSLVGAAERLRHRHPHARRHRASPRGGVPPGVRASPLLRASAPVLILLSEVVCGRASSSSLRLVWTASTSRLMPPPCPAPRRAQDEKRRVPGWTLAADRVDESSSATDVGH
jgi:hypothetical protein